jgi:hypothetical protein
MLYVTPCRMVITDISKDCNALEISITIYPSTKCNHATFHASAIMQMRSVLFWDITQRTVVIPYRRFGTTYLSILES